MSKADSLVPGTGEGVANDCDLHSDLVSLFHSFLCFWPPVFPEAHGSF